MLSRLLRGGGQVARSAFARTVGGFMVFTALGQSLYLVVAPLIGRMFTPKEVGTYGLLLTIFSIASVSICLLYDYAIPVASTDDEAQNITFGAIVIALILSPLIGAGITLAAALDTSHDLLPILSGPVVTIFLLTFALGQLGQVWRIRRGRTLSIARANLSLNVARGGAQVAGGLLYPTWWTLIAGELVGRLAFLIHLTLNRTWALQIKFDRSVRQTLGKYREFPVVLLPSQLLDTLPQLIQVSGLTYLFGVTSLGQYFLMRRTLDLPVAFVVRSLSDVFYARQALDARSAPQRIRPFFLRSVLILAVIGAIGALPLIIFRQQLFLFVFGPQWGEAGAMSAVMAPAAVLNLAVAPVSRVFNLSKRPYLRFAFGMASLAGTVLLMVWALVRPLTLFEMIVGISVVMCLSYVVYFAAGLIAASHIRGADWAMEGQVSGGA